MLKLSVVLSCLALLTSPVGAQEEEGLKVFISVDMEGIAGVVTPEETSRSGMDYGYFRRIMTEETNAAIEGALAAGASTVVVRDSHGSARNILPGLLNRNALLLRDWSGGHLSMMEGSMTPSTPSFSSAITPRPERRAPSSTTPRRAT
jgi:D-amino peptidase